MKKILVFQALLLVLAVSASAQNSGNSFVVSQVSAEARNNLIRLTWVDSPDALGPVYIFRSSMPFSGSVPANIRPVTVKYGEQYYIDDSDDMENIYYFVAASDISGRRYDVIIPRVNSTMASVSGAGVSALGAVDEIILENEPQALPPIDPIQGIFGLTARPDGEKVLITFNVNGPRKNAVLYRSTRPVKEPLDLLNAVMVQSGINSPFVDYPVPGLSYYYALIYEAEISGGSMGITPGINATISAVNVSGGRSTERTLRPMPLPAMTLNNALPEGYFLPEATSSVPLSDSASKIIRSTPVPEKAPLEQRKPRIFTVDLQAPAGGEDSALFDIISESFVKRDWEKARIGLLHYLSLPRSKDVEARARFYLGQTLYFTGNYRGALFEFLSIKATHPVEANMWIDSTLAALVY
ncbi:tetratricopeptide repeat protein [Treponema sp. R6D11]